jgi:hypothetical protein
MEFFVYNMQPSSKNKVPIFVGILFFEMPCFVFFLPMMPLWYLMGTMGRKALQNKIGKKIVKVFYVGFKTTTPQVLGGGGAYFENTPLFEHNFTFGNLLSWK